MDNKSDRIKNWPKEERPWDGLLAEEAETRSDDGTARDKVARIKVLETQRNQHIAEGHTGS